MLSDDDDKQSVFICVLIMLKNFLPIFCPFEVVVVLVAGHIVVDVARSGGDLLLLLLRQHTAAPDYFLF